MISKQFNLSSSESFIEAFSYFNKLKEKGAIIEINEVKQTRSSLQNRALYLYFTFIADNLNNHGLYFQTIDLFGMSVECEWTKDLVKEFIWKPIQKTLFDIESTTKLKTNELDVIINVLTNHFAKLNLSVPFPSSFNYWLDKIYK